MKQLIIQTTTGSINILDADFVICEDHFTVDHDWPEEVIQAILTLRAYAETLEETV